MSNTLFIVDASSSVLPYAEEYLQAINKMFEIQKSLNPESFLTVTTFNASPKFHFINRKISLLNETMTLEHLKPEGATALYDSVGAILSKLKKFHEEVKMEKAPFVILLTDGEDNISKYVDEDTFCEGIRAYKKFGWKFMFLALNEESLKVARKACCDYNILYNQTAKSFETMCEVFRLGLMGELGETDLDIRELGDLLGKMTV